MLRFFYTCLFYLIQPLVLLKMYKRSLKQPAYRQRLSERYAFYGKQLPPQPQGIHIHAASVGEVMAVIPLVKKIQANYPDLAITFTTVTPTGSERVQKAFGNTVSHFYLPYDLPCALKRFLNFVQPKAVVVVESELWPNFIYQLKQRNIPLIVANARLSARSAKRYAKFGKIAQTLFENIHLILAQDKITAERYLSLGINPSKLVNTGNLKYDLEISEQQHALVKQTAQDLQISHRPVWIAASTHEGEEKIILDAHQQLLAQNPDLLLILVPRHPERFGIAENLLQKMAMAYVKRSENQVVGRDISVLLGDTMGEMMVLYGLAQIAFVGGSLVKHGGHNPLEPIAFKLPVISGHHTFNFPEVFSKLREVAGVVEIDSDSTALSQSVQALFNDPEKCNQISQAGFSVLKENQGALARHLVQLAPFIEK